MSFRTSLYEQENDKDISRQHRHSFVNRLRTHTDGELAMNSTSFSNFNYIHHTDDSLGRSFRRNNNRFGVNHHHMAGEVMHGHTLPSSSLPVSSLYNNDRNISPISRSFRKLRSSTWDPGHGNLRLSPKMFGASSTSFDHATINKDILLSDDSDGQEDEVVSFSSSSENSAADVGIPTLDETDDTKSGTLSSLYRDDRDSTEKKYNNLQSLEESNQKFIGNTTPENDSRERNPIRQPSLMREKSSSSTDGVKRSVTFSNNVGFQQYLGHESMKDSNQDTADNLDQSPNSHDSIIYHPETIRYQQRMLQPQQQQQSRPSMKKNEPLFDHFNPFSDLSWSLVGSAIVRYAPCFLCSKKLGVSATDRNVLMRLNLLCAFHAVIQIALGLFLFVVTFLGIKQTNNYYDNVASSRVYSAEASDDFLTDVVSADLWNLMLFTWLLSVVNLVLLIASFFAQKAIRNVNLVRSVRFMWTLFWLLPIQIFCIIGLFDYYGVMEVYTKHWWDKASMTWFRLKFCPDDTYMTKCIVPIDGGEEFDSEEAWCKAYYNAIDCREIRDAAQTHFERFSYIFFTFNGAWALLLVALMYVTLCILQGIISLPIVQRSKEANIPLWLTFPIGGCFLIGSILLYGPSTVSSSFQDLYMIGLAYLVTGGAFALAAIMGISLKLYTVLNKRQKKCKQALVVVFIVTIVVTIFSVTTIFATSIIYSLNIIKIPTNAYHEIACMLDTGGSCTGCGSIYSDEICPEWSEGDVTRVLKTIMKQSATVAAIFLVYALTTLRYGFLLLKHVNSYQIDYV